MEKKLVSGESKPKIKGQNNVVTDRKRNEQILKESEDRYRLLAENVTDVIWLMDEKLDYTYISPSIQRLSGFTPDEAMQQSSLTQLVPSSFEFAYKTFQKHLEAFLGSPDEEPDPLIMELEDIRKDGSIGWSEINATFLRNPEGKFAGILGISRDITKRKQAEEELKRYRNHLEEIVAKRTEELRKINKELLQEITVQ